MVIWGGLDEVRGTILSDGAILDLEKLEWEELPEAPIDGRYGHSAVLWGSKMVIWGGFDGRDRASGVILDLEKMKWKRIPNANIKGRCFHSAVLWGSKMVVWGGRKAGKDVYFSDGAILDLEKLEWEELPELDIDGRYYHSAVLWGSKMVIWGGMISSPGSPREYYDDGAMLDLKTKKWVKLPWAPIVARARHSAILWGSKLVIWGGESADYTPCRDGAMLDLKRVAMLMGAKD
jgi:hypothetical protein